MPLTCIERLLNEGPVEQDLVLSVFMGFHVDYIAFPKYRKIPKISPGAYIFQRPFLRGLFFEGLIYGGKFAFQNWLG